MERGFERIVYDNFLDSFRANFACRATLESNGIAHLHSLCRRPPSSPFVNFRSGFYVAEPGIAQRTGMKHTNFLDDKTNRPT